MDIRSNNGFYIGDICYVLGDDVYDNFWGDQKDFADGAFEVPGRGFAFAVGSTAYGDGVYADDEGHEYPVDAGVIGLVPLELVEKTDGLDYGTVVRTPGRASLVCDGGVFSIDLPDGRTLRINTCDESDESDECSVYE